MGFFDAIAKVITKPLDLIKSKNETNREKDVAREQAGVARDTNATNLAIAEEQTKQLEKEIAFRQQQADEDRKLQLQAVETAKFLQEQGLELKEKELDLNEKLVKEQAEATKAAARAQESESAAIQNAAILSKPNLKQLAIPGLVGLYLYYKYMR